jgi:hypothetical protein
MGYLKQRKADDRSGHTDVLSRLLAMVLHVGPVSFDINPDQLSKADIFLSVQPLEELSHPICHRMVIRAWGVVHQPSDYHSWRQVLKKASEGGGGLLIDFWSRKIPLIEALRRFPLDPIGPQFQTEASGSRPDVTMSIDDSGIDARLEAKKDTHGINYDLDVPGEFLKNDKLELVAWEILHISVYLLFIKASLKDGPWRVSQCALEVVNRPTTVDQMPVMRICTRHRVS